MTPTVKSAFRLYGLGWQIAMPFLNRNPRLAEGFTHRRQGPKGLPAPIDVWIQAASVGESYLAIAICQKIAAFRPVKILITTNTRQGFDILNENLSKEQPLSQNIFIDYFPFDSPKGMADIIDRLRPRLTVLLETEIWPGLLLALKRINRPAIILNGRLSPKSLRHYLLFPNLFRAVAPEKIAAISAADAKRFKRLFPETTVGTMPNIKFDRITFPDAEFTKQNPLHRLFAKKQKLVVFGSIRTEEEPAVEKIISHLAKHVPHCQIALFPRHMHRLEAWQTILNRCGRPWIRRSAVTHPILEGNIILWDTFGELTAAYATATAAFIGGSLADLGGQNFLEPLSYGIRPVIGPYWDNFFWVGEKIFSSGLVKRCADWQTVAAALIQDINSPPDPQKIHSHAKQFIDKRRGGTMQAINLIEKMLMKGE